MASMLSDETWRVLMGQPVLMITCDRDSVYGLEQLLGEHDIAFQSSERRNLDGTVITSWLVLASVAVKVAPDLIRAMTEFLRRYQVQRIEYNGIVIERPRPEDVDAIIQKISDSETATLSPPAGGELPG